jgi:hypothetical protein
MRTKLVNGIRIELTVEENAQRDLEEQEWAAGAFGRAIGSLRRQRNARLSDSDYRALSDQNMSQEWTDYRQQLRDITQDLETVEDVKGVIWPTEPE